MFWTFQVMSASVLVLILWVYNNKIGSGNNVKLKVAEVVEFYFISHWLDINYIYMQINMKRQLRIIKFGILMAYSSKKCLTCITTLVHCGSQYIRHLVII